MSTVRPVSAYQWTCAECHDTGLERTAADALEQLEIHQDDYHA